jgi:hypothetical protein
LSVGETLADQGVGFLSAPTPDLPQASDVLPASLPIVLQRQPLSLQTRSTAVAIVVGEGSTDAEGGKVRARGGELGFRVEC